MRLAPVLTPAQLHRWDLAAVAAGTSLSTLMDRAGHAVADLVAARFDALARRGVLVACGAGNNGGDGWVAAQVLHRRGYPVSVIESAAPRAGIALEARHAALDAGVHHLAISEPRPACAVAIDALLGAGAEGVPRDGIARVIAMLRDLAVPVIAVDGPSGLDLLTGVDHGAIAADVSVTFGGPRRGHLMARDVVGDIVVADIGMPPIPPDVPVLVTSRWAAAALHPLPARSHKGTRGRVVIIGGAPSMAGAARLAARGAFGAGAGLVHVAAPSASLEVLRVAEPDVQVSELSLQPGETQELRARADAVVIGPGLGRDDAYLPLVTAAITAARAVVIDADALVLLANAPGEMAALRDASQAVITPHVGEFRMLFPSCPADPERDPWGAAEHAATVCGCTVLLKGVPSVIASRDHVTRTVAAGNPGLGTGGSGDVLSGIIGALLAQGVAAFDAATLGAQALGDAADHAARRHTARAMRPMDVVSALPDTWRAWSRLTEMPATAHILLPRPRGT